jgi:hypothetical protein
VFPQRDVSSELVNAVFGEDDSDDLPEEYRLAKKDGNPFGLFTLTMTEGTIAAGRVFGADLVVYTSDHASGWLAAVALAVPALEVGNRISWSMRDELSHDPKTVDAATMRASVERLLGEPAFAAAAREVSTEMARQSSPSAVIERLTGRCRELGTFGA